MIIFAALLLAATPMECHTVTDDVIRMRDLAAFEPAFSAMDADAIAAYSPLPGATRILQAAQLARLARMGGVTEGDFRDACFQRAMRQLRAEELREAIHHSLAIPEATLELTDFSRYPAPVGDLVFPRSGLALSPSPSNEPLLWKGYVIYGSGHQFPVWARVKIHAKLNRVVAIEALSTGSPIRADQVRIEPLDGVPTSLAPAQSLDQVVGKNLLRPLSRGATVSLDDVASARAVRRGDKVDVDVESGALHLRFEAAAETDGRFGDRISLRNLQSGTIFTAEISGKDQVRIVIKN